MSSGAHITVTSRWEGFRRAGRAWSVTPTTVAVESLSTDQLQAIEREPALIVAWGDGYHTHQRERDVEPCPEGGEAESDSTGGEVDPDSGSGPLPGDSPSDDDPGSAPPSTALEAIALLDLDDPAQRTRDGAPRVDAIEAILGRGITMAERDAAWAQFQARS